MKTLQDMGSYLLIGFSLLLLVGCSLAKHDFPPKNLPQAPNCAADGPGCKQFNPDKPSGNEGGKY